MTGKVELLDSELTKVSGGNTEIVFPDGEVLRAVSGDEDPTPTTTPQPNYTQDNSNNSGAQQNVQGDNNSNSGGINVTH